MSNKKILVIFLILSFISLSLEEVSAFELTSEVNEKSACAGSTLLFNALVSGTGSFTVNLDGEAGSWSVAVPNSFTLNNEVKTLYVYVTPKSITSPGPYNLNLVVTSTAGEVKTVNYKINVLDCHKVSITGAETKDVCGCDVERYDFVVSNQGQFQEFYTLAIGGSAAEFATLSQNTLLLNPGESRQVFVYIAAPCGNFGLYDFTLTVNSETSNAAASFDSQVNIQNCFNFDLSPDKDFISLCEHSAEELPIRITNNANNPNNFELKITGPAWANLENNNLALAALQTGQVDLILSPDYRVQGMFDINLNVEGTEGKIKKERTIKAEVKKCHDVLFEIIESGDKICSALTKVYEVSVKNTGQSSKEYKLETSEVWARLDEGIVTLESGEEKRVNLEISPSANLTAKKYDVYARAIALDTSKVQSEDFINIEVVSSKNCYKPSLNAQGISVSQEGSATIPVVVENQGSELANYNLALSGTATSFSQLNPATIEVEPGKSEIVYVYTAPSLMIEPGNYKAGISIRIEDSGILASTTVNIDVGKAAITEDLIVPKEPGLVDKIRNWLSNLLRISPVIEEVDVVIDFKEERAISGDTRFTYQGEEHTIRILEVGNDSVSLVIESSPIILLLGVGEEKEVDVDDDGVNDLRVTLGAIEDGKPIVRVVEIEEELPPEEEIVEEVVEEVMPPEEELVSEVIVVEEEVEIPNFYDRLRNLSSAYRNYIIGVIIIFVALVLILASQETKRMGKKKEEELWKYLFALLLIIAIVLLVKNFSALIGSWLVSYVSPYKTFILIAIIILIILVFLISNWKKVVDFFEEEIEEEEETNKKPNRKKVKKK